MELKLYKINWWDVDGEDSGECEEMLAARDIESVLSLWKEHFYSNDIPPHTYIMEIKLLGNVVVKGKEFL